MEVSDTTLNVLKNFATINPSLLFPAGDKLATLSPKKNIMAKAKIEESIPKRFAIYDLNQFLGVVSLFKKRVLCHCLMLLLNQEVTRFCSRLVIYKMLAQIRMS